MAGDIRLNVSTRIREAQRVQFEIRSIGCPGSNVPEMHVGDSVTKLARRRIRSSVAWRERLVRWVRSRIRHLLGGGRRCPGKARTQEAIDSVSTGDIRRDFGRNPEPQGNFARGEVGFGLDLDLERGCSGLLRIREQSRRCNYP